MEVKFTNTQDIECAIRTILSFIGEDPCREGLKGTPDRIIRMWREIFRGYDLSQVPKITVFPNGVDGLSCDSVIADSGGFYSMSKVGRVVDYCAARLQVQERLAKDIIVMIQEALGSEYPPLAMGIVLEGEHLCKSMRGVKKEGKMRSSFYFDNGSLPELRAELSRFVSFG